MHDGRSSMSLKVLQALGVHEASIKRICAGGGRSKSPNTEVVADGAAMGPPLLARQESDVAALAYLQNIGTLGTDAGVAILHPRVGLVYLRHLWENGARKTGLRMLEGLIHNLTHSADLRAAAEAGGPSLLLDCHMTLGQWRQHQAKGGGRRAPRGSEGPSRRFGAPLRRPRRAPRPGTSGAR